MTEAPYLFKPGIHSHNLRRFSPAEEPKNASAHIARIVLLLIGITALGYYAYTLADQRIYQDFGNWSFEQQIAGHPHTTWTDYLYAKTKLKWFERSKADMADVAAPKPSAAPPPVGAIIGRVGVERLHLSAIVRQGVDDQTLSDSVGHVPSTALPGQAGNFAIAAHRDTLFRALKDIRKDDLISLQSSVGTFTYQVEATKIVRPTDVSVLRPDGGGLVEGDKLLTMITCYPFYYVGSAPKRFIVEAKLVN